MKKIVVASTVLMGFIFSSCSKESVDRTGGVGSDIQAPRTPATETIMATVSSGNTYILNLGGSSKATIVRQALHYQSSETVTDKGDGGLTYQYRPASGYAGADEVMISYTGTGNSTSEGCLGNSHPAGLTNKQLTIKLTVTN